MMPVAFVLSAHMPYLRHAGGQPEGEERLHELIAGAILPLLHMTKELRNGGFQPRLSIAFSPLLIEQLADPAVQKHFTLWSQAQIAAIEGQLEAAMAHGDEHRAYVANFYLDWQRQLHDAFTTEYQRNLVKPLAALQHNGVIEALAAPATWSYLPSLHHPAAVRAQLELGTLTILRRLGRPLGLWVPQRGWRPGIEQIAVSLGLRYMICDIDSLSSSANQAPVWLVTRRLAGLVSSTVTRQHLDSVELGYRGDPLYRRPPPTDPMLAHGLGEPQIYDPFHAFQRAQEHAQHFVAHLEAEAAKQPAEALLLVPLDLNQIGAEWFEGIAWLQHVLILCMGHGGLDLVTPQAYLNHHRPRGRADLRPLPLSNQGQQIEHQAVMQAAEARMAQLAGRTQFAHEQHQRVVAQAARELLLAQASAVGARWSVHINRFAFLCELLERPLTEADQFTLEEIEERDNPFPALNPQIFCR